MNKRIKLNGVTLANGADLLPPPETNAARFPTNSHPGISPARIKLAINSRWNPIRGLTPDRLVAMLDSWRTGFFREAGMLFDAIERRDYQTRVVAPKRKKAPARHGYEVLTLADADGADKIMAETQREFLQDFYDHLTATDAMNPDERGGLALALRQMMDAVGKYYSVHEIIWRPKPDGTLAAQLIHCPVWWFEGTEGKLRFLENEFQTYGVPMPPGEWLVTTGEGLMEPTAFCYLFKILPLKSWLNYIDKFGMPGLHGKTNAPKGSAEWNDFKESLIAFAEEWTCITDPNNEINLVEVKGVGSSQGGQFESIVEKMDRAITQLWRGGDLGTNSAKDAVGATLQEDESDILETDDAMRLEETLTQQLSRYALAWKFGPDAPQLAYLKLRTSPKTNLADDVMIDKFLLAAGAPLGVRATMERYARTPAGDGDEVLPGAAKPAENGGDANENEAGEKADVANVGPDAGLQRAQLEAFARAAERDFAPVADELNAILAIEDPAIFTERLRAWAGRVEKRKADIAADPDAARALQDALATSLVNGLAETKARQARV